MHWCGDNGIITNAQRAAFASKIASYKEEFEMNIIREMENDGIVDKEMVTVLGESVKRYIPSLKEEDIGLFGIIGGEIFYIGEDKLEQEVALSYHISIKPEGISIDEYAETVKSNAIENVVKNLGGDAFFYVDEEDNEYVGGIPLYDKNYENAAKWKLITEVESNEVKAIYGSDWYYVPTGTNIDGVGVTTYDLIVNYNERKIVRFDASKHTMMSYKSTLAVGDSLIFNADPSVIEEKNTDSFGKNVELNGYRDDLSDCFTNSYFIFDGVDDCINLSVSDVDLTKGFTYEIYGKLNGIGKHYLIDGEEVYRVEQFGDKAYPYYFDGFFGLWNGNEKEQARLRFGLFWNRIDLGKDDEGKQVYQFNGVEEFVWNWGLDKVSMTADKENEYYHYVNEGFAPSSAPWNHYLVLDNYDLSLDIGEDFSFAICVDAQNLKQTAYFNGVKIDEGEMVKSNWDNWCNAEENLPSIKKITLGRCSQRAEGWWNYLCANVYSLRLYNRGLSESEEIANYNATVSYHQFLVNNGVASTGGEIKGEDY
ncbi:MAG: hypothetical protein IJ867_02680 [Clostridia bacterium]|nr:hypothetical protein [Clostridia bacterium]